MDTMPPVSILATKLAALGDLAITPNILFAGKVHLFQNNIAPQQQSLLTDFEEATFTGYLAVAWGTWGTPFIGIDGLARINAPSLQFQPTDAVTPNTIYGAFMTNTAGTVLLWAVLFVTPVPLPDASEAVVYIPEYVYAA